MACTAQAPLLCAAAPLASPAAQRTNHTLYSIASALARMAAIPAPPAAADGSGGGGSQQASPVMECVTLLTWWVALTVKRRCGRLACAGHHLCVSHFACDLTTCHTCTLHICRLRLTIAVLAPLAFEAASEARLWNSHCRSRAAAGLPAEKAPWGARQLYRAARLLTWQEGGAHAALMGWLLLALYWEWCRFAVALWLG